MNKHEISIVAPANRVNRIFIDLGRELEPCAVGNFATHHQEADAFEKHPWLKEIHENWHVCNVEISGSQLIVDKYKSHLWSGIIPLLEKVLDREFLSKV